MAGNKLAPNKTTTVTTGKPKLPRRPTAKPQSELGEADLQKVSGGVPAVQSKQEL